MEKVNMLIIKKLRNSIVLEIQDNETGKIIDQSLQTLTTELFYKDDLFNKTKRTFNRYAPYSIITFDKNKEHIDVFIRLMEQNDITPGVVIDKSDKYYIKFSENGDVYTIINGNTIKTRNLLSHFQAVYADFDTPNIIHPYRKI